MVSRSVGGCRGLVSSTGQKRQVVGWLIFHIRPHTGEYVIVTALELKMPKWLSFGGMMMHGLSTVEMRLHRLAEWSR